MLTGLYSKPNTMRHVAEYNKMPLIAVLMSLFLFLINLVQPFSWWLILAPLYFPVGILLIYVIYLIIKEYVTK